MAKPIGEILIEQGSITKEQLEKALDQQKSNKTKRRLGEVLIDMGVIAESDIVIALSTQFNYPYLPLNNVSPNSETLNLIPENLIRKYLTVPIDKHANLLTVAMADPSDDEAVSEIEKLSQCKTQIFISTMSEIEALITRYCGNSQRKKSE